MARSKQVPGSWKDIRSALKGASQRDLMSLVGDLYGLRKENKDFLHARFIKDGDVLGPYKEIIEVSVSPAEPWRHPIRLAPARKAISDYRKAIGDPDGLTELMLFYAECGVGFALEFGVYDEAFYNSVESVFCDGLKMLQKCRSEVADKLLPRFVNTVRSSDDLGWSFHDDLLDALEAHFPGELPQEDPAD